MRTAWLLCALLAAAGFAGAAWAGAVSPAGFFTPSRNIGCAYFPAFGNQAGYLRCDIRSGLRPEPARRCELDWTGMDMGLRGRATPTCAGDTVLGIPKRVLPYGRSWRRDGLRCDSRRDGLRCVNRAGHGFFLSRASWRVF